MTTFLQVIGYIALAAIILALFDMIYSKHFRWLNGYHAWTGKKGVHKKRRSREFRDVLPEPQTPYDEGEQT